MAGNRYGVRVVARMGGPVRNADSARARHDAAQPADPRCCGTRIAIILIFPDRTLFAPADELAVRHLDESSCRALSTFGRQAPHRHPEPKRSRSRRKGREDRSVPFRREAPIERGANVIYHVTICGQPFRMA